MIMDYFLLGEFVIVVSGKHLNFLYLSDNDFRGSQFPDFNGSLSRLRHLNIANAGLSWRILNQLGNLSRLDSNHVGENNWLKLVNKLPLHLENLQLRSCGLHGIILSQPLNGSFASLIRVINVSRNRLTSSSALKWLTNISSNLAELNLEYNNLIQASIPGIFRNMASLKHLYLSDNQLRDGIQGILGNICTLQTLDLSHNNLTGLFPQLPRCIESSLEIFNLDWNSLHGPLPDFTSHNRFNGTVTESLGCLSRLKHLLASRNSMEDLLSPNTLFITEMDLSSNMFDGSLPLLPYINVLNLAKNRFTGSLDPFCKITSKYLTFLESGNIPAWIGENLPSLVFLSLQANDFNGRILANFCWLAHMQILDQSENNISGTIPSCLNNLTAMAQKRVYTYGGGRIFEYVIGFLFRRTGYNYVEKARVRWKGNDYEYERYIGLFRVIDLSSNGLTGEIPNEITSLFELVAPNLSRNGLTGLIPHNINQLKQLKSLNLSENHLSGRIPVTMADLTFLSYLDLYNKLLGRIPSSTQLQTFDALVFVGNALAFVGNQALCGSQVTVQCTEDDTNPNKPDHNKLENGDVFRKWFYAQMRVGF
ncbi:hypothetical protein GOBAR_DD28992 [Gossypium barbadense]|nr:hypothetical protein GOBAR_DD28992 [Gossypium barbadense]